MDDEDFVVLLAGILIACGTVIPLWWDRSFLLTANPACSLRIRL
jgi:hypothetical protein